MTPHYVNQGGELNWLLDDLVTRVPRVSKAVMLTQDGLAIGASARLNREDAEHLAALASGFQSMARGAGQHFGGGRVRQTMIIEMETAFLFVGAAGHGTCLAVLTTGEADVGLVAYEMAVLVRRASEHLGVAPRPTSYGPDHSAQRPPTMTGSNGRGVPYPAQPAPPAPGAAPPYLPGRRMTPPSMAGQLAGQAGLAGSHPSRPLPKLMPQQRDAPAWDSVYSLYPMPAGHPESAPYTE